MIVLTFRGRTLEVSSEVIKTFDEVELTREAKVKEQEGDAGNGKPKAGYAKVEGIKADSVSFEVQLSQAAGTDVLEEMQGWRALVDGQSARIYFAGNDILGLDMTLTACQATEMRFDGAGIISRAKLKLTFMQGRAGKAKSKSKTVEIKITQQSIDYKTALSNATNDIRNDAKNFQSVFTPAIQD